MARRPWKVLVVADDDSVRQLRLPREVARIGIALALFVIAAISSLTTAFVVGAGADTRLQAKNELLEDELADLSHRIDTLQYSLDHLAEKDEFYRLLAGLEPVDPDVLLAGVGGPDSETAEAQPLFTADASAARRTFKTSQRVSSLIRRARLLTSSWRQAEDTLSEHRARFEATPSIVPADGYVSSAFSVSRWHPILDRPRPHAGVDIVARFGAPVVAAARGRVQAVGQQSEYGLVVDVDHGYGIVTRYAHLSRATVQVGQTVQRGERVGAVGMSGLAVGPHLHYEVLLNGEAANPRRYMRDLSVVRD
jgi:murein DD-endopeptidase MepM/ murein hydrolase activator NlpD